MRNILEVQDTSIVVVLTWEDRLTWVGRMDVGNGVLVSVPPTETHVQTAHECNAAVNETEFLMMGPVQDRVIVNAV